MSQSPLSETTPKKPVPQTVPMELLAHDATVEGASPVVEETNFLRTILGGMMMGVANIIPGVSGGTMLLAVGLYDRFVAAVAEVTKLKFRKWAVLFLAIIVFSAVVGIAIGNTPILWSLRNIPHVTLALFIGLTLGGVPLLWRELRPIKPIAIVWIILGFLAMWGVTKMTGTPLPRNFLIFFVAGVVGSMAMVLPGISGSYVLLIFGLYVPISIAIDEFKNGVKALDVAAAWEPAFNILFPVGVGVLVGVALVSNALKALIKRFPDPTHGFLLGLLVGSVLGLYPFQELRDKEVAESGEVVFTTIGGPTEPTPGAILIVVLMVAVGFGITWAIARFGKSKGLPEH